MMSKQIFKWKSDAVQCYYNSELLPRGKNIKFYTSFIHEDWDYKVGEFVFVRNKAKIRDRICMLKCIYDDRKEPSAIVRPCEYATNVKSCFYRISEEFDDENEVVMNVKEEIIRLKNIVGKCRVIFGVKDDCVSELIEDKNLNKEFYFLCRYQYNEINGDLNLIINSTIKNGLSIGETTQYECFPNRTPSPKKVWSNKKLCIKKNCSETMEVDSPQLAQVKRNLNLSFNDSQSQDDCSLLNYSIVEEPRDNLKLKLRVSNGKVLSNIPDTQPVVLLNTLDTKNSSNKRSAIYEIKSPSLGDTFQPNERKTRKNNSAELQETPRKSSRRNDLNSMVENLKINDKTPVKASPRKLRKLSIPLYCENYSDSDSDTCIPKRKSTRIQAKAKNERSIRTRSASLFSESDDNPVKRKEQNDRKCYEHDEELHEKSPRKKRCTSENKGNTQLELMKETTKSSKSTPRSSRLLKNYTPLKLIREGTLTPSIDSRKKTVMKNNTPLVLARNNLHVSYVPTTLPCREKEYEEVYNFIEGKLIDKCGGCMYISGVPGTGKTATVTVAIENIIMDWKKHGNPEFNYVMVNGMRLTEPRQCYVEILKQLTGKRMPWEQALTTLEEKFTTKNAKKVVPTILLIDELDILCTKRQDVVYNLLDWPTKTNAQLIVITIANTMDLPERLLMSRVTSRLGLTRLTFQAYTHKQLQEIVVNRLTGNNSFKSDAIQFVARKVASVSGDARRALDICRRSAEIAEVEGPTTQVSMKHVNAALDAMITEPKVKAIAHCSKLEKLVLQSVIAEVERTGVEETVFNDVYVMLISLAALEGFKMVSVSLMASAVYRLSSCRLILADQKCVDINQRIILNVSADDVYYALKKD